MVNNDVIESDELNEKPNKVEKPEHAATAIKQYANITRTKRKIIYPSRIIKEAC